MIPSDFAALQLGHEELKTRVGQIAAELKNNTATTQRIEQNTSEIVEVFTTLKGGFKVLGWLGNGGKYLLWLGIPLVAASTWWHDIKIWLSR